VPRPDVTIHGARVTLRPGEPADAAALRRIREEPAVRAWWHEPDPVERVAAELAGDTEETVFVLDVDGEIAGAIQFYEETDPHYRHASIDVYLATAFQGRGLGSAALCELAAYLVDVRGHHRLTIDPAVDNAAAIASYEKVGFRRVGVMRSYERREDGHWYDALLMDLLADDLSRAESSPARPKGSSPGARPR